jgi:hypothetical protein
MFDIKGGKTMTKKGKGTLAKVGKVVGPIMAAVLPDAIKKGCRGLYDRLRGGKATKVERELKKIAKMRKNGQISQAHAYSDEVGHAL